MINSFCRLTLDALTMAEVPRGIAEQRRGLASSNCSSPVHGYPNGEFRFRPVAEGDTEIRYAGQHPVEVKTERVESKSSAATPSPIVSMRSSLRCFDD